ncbi:MAG: ComF family protein, partial [Planctomycetota bacterium]
MASFAYRDPAARAAILAFKHGGRRDLCAPLVRAMIAGVPEQPGPFDLLVPVPSHPARVLSRGYDPPALLAMELELAGAGQRASVLRRVRATPPQGSAGAPGRRSNVRGAFRCAV